MSEDQEFEMAQPVRRAVRCALDRKARNVTVMDVRNLSSVTDFFVIATGRSDVHARTIAEHVIDSAKRDGLSPEHVEGLDQGRWVLVDYIDYVVHVFHPAVREYYQLELLWGDAKTMVVEEA